jgi:hypothetical protein
MAYTTAMVRQLEVAMSGNAATDQLLLLGVCSHPSHHSAVTDDQTCASGTGR